MFRSRAMMYLVLFALHLFIGLSVIGDLGLTPAAQLPFWALLLLSFVLVPLGFRSRDMNSRLLAWAALIAMGVFSSLAVFSLLRGLVVALASLIGQPLDAAWRSGSAWAVLGYCWWPCAVSTTPGARPRSRKWSWPFRRSPPAWTDCASCN